MSHSSRGSCLCGDITWQIDAEPVVMSNCHCSMCRKLHGSAFATYAGVAASAFRWTSGEGAVQRYASSPGTHRCFCQRCGSVLPTVTPGAGSVFVPAGNLDGDIGRRPDNHIFVRSKAPWFEITDDAPRFAGFPDGYDAPEVQTAERLPALPGAIGGSCLCGAVAFELDETTGRAGYCHCSRCRKSRSAAHSAQTFALLDRFRWVRGKDHVRSFKLPGSARFEVSFCSTCGSTMPTALGDPGLVMVPLGALDQDPGVRPQAHIYVGSKAPWFEITDGLPQFIEMPPGT